MLNRAFWTALLFAVVFAAGSARADEVRKVFELTDGSVVVGVVLDELDTGYLVRTVEGETVRVAYDQITSVTIIGGSASASAPSAATEEENERSDSAGVRFHLSEGAAVGAGVLFGTGMGTVGAGSAIALETNEELPATPIVIGGIVQVTVGAVLLGVSTDHARSAARLYDIDTSAPFGVVVGGIVVQTLGIGLGAAAVPVAIEESEDTGTGLAIGAIVLGIAGHVMAQAGAGRIRSLVAVERDADTFGQASGRDKPRVKFAGVWTSRTGGTRVVGASFVF
jgi:hypothetical protein